VNGKGKARLAIRDLWLVKAGECWRAKRASERAEAYDEKRVSKMPFLSRLEFCTGLSLLELREILIAVSRLEARNMAAKEGQS
jgi:hypothetical protein